MQLIASDIDPTHARMLDGYESPAILVSRDYEILAANDLYADAFGMPEITATLPRCYAVSHGYDRPCDQAGETCPLAAAAASGERERVLHIHQTPNGREHVDVEMLPIAGEQGTPEFYVELLRPLPTAGEQAAGQYMTGQSAAFNDMLTLISRVARSDVAVLLTGESGTGKELAAHTLHRNSSRKREQMVTLECAGLSESLFESELFGHVRGAFTGANYRKAGLVEAANGGSLFLDEIGDIPLPLQVKLLRLIETGTYRQVGSTDVRHADFRLVCATHKDLGAMVRDGRFRQDLYYRINVFPVRVPALRERPEDIPLLANMFLKASGQGGGLHFTESAIQLLRSYTYPGNVRELRNVVVRCSIIGNSNVMDRSVVERAISGLMTHRDSDGTPLTNQRHEDDVASVITLRQAERQHLNALMQHFANDKQAVAQAAGISVRSLYRKLADGE
ncbi:MAG: sigma-54 interaction domain-containing protein [Chromatocurvus sp.]